MNPTLDLTRLPDDLKLITGHHNINDKHTGCAMDAIAWATTGEVTDMPECVHQILTRKVHQINDANHTTEADRWHIVREGGPLLVGSNEWPVARVLWVVARAGGTAQGFVASLPLDHPANLSGANLARADLAGAYLVGVNLAGANLARANLTGAYLTRADLTGANLAGSYLTEANLAGSYLTETDLAGADLAGANLTETDLAGAYLSGAYLAGAYLTRADLTGANLSGAYLTETDLAGANLTGAEADKSTVWPAGFDAVAAGVVFK